MSEEREMKKDKTWAMNQINNLDGVRIKGNFADFTTIPKDKAIRIISDMDEPETLSIDKEQLIKRIENYIPLHDKTVGDVVDGILETVKQLPEMEVLCPEWIDNNTQLDMNPTSRVVPAFLLENILVPRQEVTHKQVEKYLLDKNIRVIDIDIYEEMQSELEELKNGATLSKTETVADVIADFFKSLERLKEAMSMEVGELEE